MTYKIVLSTSFKRDLKRISKQRKDLRLLNKVVDMLADDAPLPAKYHDHALRDSRWYHGVRECHIRPDWLLVYEKHDNDLILLLVRTGSHSELFDK